MCHVPELPETVIHLVLSVVSTVSMVLASHSLTITATTLNPAVCQLGMSLHTFDQLLYVGGDDGSQST